ncbi:MAG: hypothetical protein AAGD43_03435 [Pseudomonadota bacterium]
MKVDVLRVMVLFHGTGLGIVVNKFPLSDPTGAERILAVLGLMFLVGLNFGTFALLGRNPKQQDDRGGTLGFLSYITAIVACGYLTMIFALVLDDFPISKIATML